MLGLAKIKELIPISNCPSSQCFLKVLAVLTAFFLTILRVFSGSSATFSECESEKVAEDPDMPRRNYGEYRLRKVWPEKKVVYFFSVKR